MTVVAAASTSVVRGRPPSAAHRGGRARQRVLHAGRAMAALADSLGLVVAASPVVEVAPAALVEMASPVVAVAAQVVATVAFPVMAASPLVV